MIKSLIAVLFTIICTFCDCWSQNASDLHFYNLYHDFGEVDESKGMVSHDFVFVNKSSQSVVIKDVKSSCGCTIISWTKDTLKQGESGVVVAGFDPSNRHGSFNKYLTVFGKGISEGIRLYISGHVIVKNQDVLERLEVDLGNNLRLKSNTLNLGSVANNKVLQQKFEVYNNSRDEISISEAIASSDIIDISLQPSTLQPFQGGHILVKYDSKKAELGLNEYNVALKTNKADSIEVHIVASVHEYFEELNEDELEKAPNLVLNRKNSSGLCPGVAWF